MFYSRNDETQENIFNRAVGSLSLEIDIQNLLGPGTEQLAVASPALTKGLD